MDKQNKPHQTPEDQATPEPGPAPLQARSPYRPLSRRRRQAQTVELPSAVERPVISARFDASPIRISAALAKAGASAAETVLAWKADPAAGSGADDAEISVEPAEPAAEG